MKYQFIKRHRLEFPVVKMCRVLGVVASGYYSWLKHPKSKREQENEMLLEKIQEIFNKNKGRYGSPRITDDLREQGHQCGKNRIAELMRQNGIKAKGKRKYKVTTDSEHSKQVAPNLLNQKFTATAMNQIWVTDITYIWTREGWLYLAAILDLHTRGVIGWALESRMTKELVAKAFVQAIMNRKPPRGVIHHSDRGSQYASDDYRRLMKLYGFVPSMSRKGNCWDNALMESFFHTLKTELVHDENYRTRAEARKSIFEYIEIYYNRQRKHSALGYKTPWQMEKMISVA